MIAYSLVKFEDVKRFLLYYQFHFGYHRPWGE